MNMIMCPDCENKYEKDELYTHPETEELLCFECISNYEVSYCSECDKYHQDFYFNHSSNMCNECWEETEDCVRCKNCEEWISVEDNNVNKNGDSVCSVCYLEDENTFIIEKEDIDKNKLTINIYESGGQYEYKDDIVNIVIDTHSIKYGEIDLKHFFKIGDRHSHKGYGRKKLLFFIKYLSDNVEGFDDVKIMKLITLEQEKRCDALKLKKYYNSYGFRKYDEFKSQNGKIGFNMKVNFKSFLKKYIW